eukprot:gene7387-15082_t
MNNTHHSHFTLTYVRFITGDHFGHFLALVTLAPIFIMVMYASIIALKRELHTIWAVIGQIIGVIFSILLKKLLSQKRPEQSGLEDEGMPSNHAQFITFFFLYHALIKFWVELF